MGRKLIQLILVQAMIFSSVHGFFPESAYGHQLEVQAGIHARQSENETSVLDRVGYIRPGSVLRIPQRYWAEMDSDIDGEASETTIMNWLRRSGDLRNFSSGEEIRRDYYFPVEIVSAPQSGLPAGTEVMVPIRYLVRNNGLRLSLVEKVKAIATQPEQETVNQNMGQDSHRRMTDLLEKHLNKYLEMAEGKTEENVRNRMNAAAGKVRFNRSCPISFQVFRKELQKVADRQKIPAELLLSIMHLETSGNCFALRNEADGSKSVGLFQINTTTTSISACKSWQLNEIKNAKTVQYLRNASLKCLQNPIANLEEAAQILRDKYAMVNSRKQPASGRWYNFEMQARDDWRKALAAYNGGQGYVYQAYYDILDYNQKTGADLNPDHWEHRRLFFFRQVLDARIDRSFFQKSIRHRRTLTNILTNMAYVESIAGRESDVNELTQTLVFKWIKHLYFQPKQSLASL